MNEIIFSNLGIEKMKNAIQVFEILGENNLKAQYTEHYSKNVKKI
ncbi:hypothetical protein [Streptococcus intermedius]|jgi:hypothetical protein|nr:hypothetical protein [Streptococcus intermedius]